MLLDSILMLSLGFLGSFGHCLGMCGPLTVAFTTGQHPRFHLWLNLGRLLSYGFVGALLGGLGELLLVGGQMAGVGSELRRSMAIATGLMLIWLSLGQIAPGLLPQLPILGLGPKQHDRLSKLMLDLSFKQPIGTPLLLGLCWGLMPCGFLYTAQIRALETGRGWMAALLMLAFGLGTLPMMTGVGWLVGRWSSDRRSQLYRLGGWVTLVVGGLLLLRSGDSHNTALSAYGSLLLLGLALVARPLSQRWPKWLAGPMRYRRGLGVGSFLLAIAHMLQVLSVNWGWNWQAVRFLIPSHRLGVVLGLVAIILMTPAALTSFDRLQQYWKPWRQVHLLTVPALGLALGHVLLLDRPYGDGGVMEGGAIATILLILLGTGTFVLRCWQPQKN